MKKLSNPALFFFIITASFVSFISGSYFAKLKFTPAVAPVDTRNVPVFLSKNSDRPQLDFFVMSFCPYGNQIETALRPVFDLLKDRADFTPHYIFIKVKELSNFCKQMTGDVSQCPSYVKSKYFKDLSECQQTVSQSTKRCLDEKSYFKSKDGNFYTSLHGRQEANQNIREICAWDQTNDKKTWWDFVGLINKNCSADNADTCWEQQGKAAGLDTNKITECFNVKAFNIIEKEIDLTTKLQVSTSPTTFINDIKFPPAVAYTQDSKGSLKIGKNIVTQDKYRTPNVIKEAVCSSMKKPSKECATKLGEISDVAPAASGCGNL